MAIQEFTGTYSGAAHFNQFNYEVQRTNHFEVLLDLKEVLEKSSFSWISKWADSAPEHVRLFTKSISAPKISSEIIELRHGNNRVKVASAPSFDNLTLTVYDTIGVDQISVLQAWFDLVFNHQSGLMGCVDQYKASGWLYMYSPDCSFTRKWILEGVWPSEFGASSDFSFDSAEAQNISLTLAVDRYYEETQEERAALRLGN